MNKLIELNQNEITMVTGGIDCLLFLEGSLLLVICSMVVMSIVNEALLFHIVDNTISYVRGLY